MDLPNYGDVGLHGGADGGSENARAVLCRAVSSGAGGGRVFCGGNRFSFALVHGEGPGPGAGELYGGDTGGAGDQPEVVECAAEDRHYRDGEWGDGASSGVVGIRGMA